MDLKHGYTQAIYQQKILILGLNPPPWGGISVHIRRVRQRLEQQQNVVLALDVTQLRGVGIINYGRYLRTLTQTLLTKRPQIIYYHVLALWKFPIDLVLLVFFKLFLNFKLINIEHVGRFVTQQNWWYRQAVTILFCAVEQHVLMGQSNYHYYQQAGWLANSVHRSKSAPNTQLSCQFNQLARQHKSFVIESPFLPPDIQTESQIVVQYPPELLAFIARHDLVLLVNASRISFWQGIDVYGLDLAVQLLQDLRGSSSDTKIGLILAIANLDQPAYLAQLITAAADLAPHIFSLTGPHELWPLMRRVDLFIRPTSTDNCAVSEAEAAYFQVPSVASDVCQRSLGTVLFKTRDQADLNLQVQRVLAQTNQKLQRKCGENGLVP